MQDEMEGNVIMTLQKLFHLMSPHIAGWICSPCRSKRKEVHPVPEFGITVIHPCADFRTCAVVMLSVAGALGWRIQPDKDGDGSFTTEMCEDTEAGVTIIRNEMLSHQSEINDKTEVSLVFGDCTNLWRRTFIVLKVTAVAANYTIT
jgi:hypothetical protein